ncbi:trypsin-like peptidase domain-containing protein [Nocardiopsis terrae]
MSNRTRESDWQFRVIDDDGTRMCGAAVLVSADHLLTCAHVVRTALARTGLEAGPGSVVHLDAPRGDARWRATATVVPDGWWEDTSPWDAAVLRLDHAVTVPPAVPAPHGDARTPRRPVRFVGGPRAGAGYWITGRLIGTGGTHNEYVQIDTDSAAGITVSKGYSGSGVRDLNSGDLLGIVTEKGSSGRAGWMIPLDIVPPVPGMPRSARRSTDPRAGTGGGAPRDRLEAGVGALTTLAQQVSRLRTLLIPDHRTEFYLALPSPLPGRLRADQDPFVFSSNLVTLAHRDYACLREVLTRLDDREQGSEGMRRVWEAAGPLLGAEET